MDKKLIKMLLILIVGIIALVLVVSLAQKAFKHTAFKYSTVRTTLQNAAINYAKNHKDKMPQSSKEHLELSDSFLVSEGYLKPYDKLYDDDIACNGYVDIYREEEKVYTYMTVLNCNDKKRETLYDKVLEDNNYGVVESTGLYAYYKGEFIKSESKLNDPNITSKASYVFRGDETKKLYNYIQLENMIWRILEIDENGDFILIYNEAIANYYSWDNRYNGEFDNYTGINDFYKDGLRSNVSDKLGSFYLGTLRLEGGNTTSYSHMVQMINLPMDLCVGKRTSTDEGYDGSIECSEKIKDQDVGILPAYMYMRASLDENCTTMTSPYCTNHNFLANYDSSYWLLTASSKNSNTCFYVDGNIKTDYCRSKYSIKPIIKIPGDLLVKYGAEGGVGSKNKPYRLYSFYRKTISEKEKK